MHSVSLKISFTCAFAYLHGFQQLHSLNNVSDINSGGFTYFQLFLLNKRRWLFKGSAVLQLMFVFAFKECKDYTRSSNIMALI